MATLTGIARKRFMASKAIVESPFNQIKGGEEMDLELEKRIEVLEKRVAELEGQVQEQPKIKSAKQIIENQIIVLEQVQQTCINNGSFDLVEQIAKTLLEMVTTYQSINC